MAKLNPKQEAFVQEYLSNGFNATAAYWNVYSNVKTYRTAAVNGSRLLKNADIQKKILAFQDKIEQKTIRSRERVLKELAKVAYAKVDTLEGVTYAEKRKYLEAISKIEGYLSEPGAGKNSDSEDGSERFLKSVEEAMEKGSKNSS